MVETEKVITVDVDNYLTENNHQNVKIIMSFFNKQVNISHKIRLLVKTLF